MRIIITTIFSMILLTFSNLVIAEVTSQSELQKQLIAIEDNMSATPEQQLMEYQSLLAIAEQNEWQNSIVRVNVAIVETYLALERLQTAQSLISEYLPKSDTTELIESNVRLVLAQLRINHIQNQPTSELLEDIYSKLTLIKDKKILGGIYSVLGTQFYEKGQLEQAITYQNLAREQYEAIDYKYGLASTVNSLANIYSAKSEYKMAIEYLQESLGIMRSLKSKYNESIILFNLAHNYGYLKDYDKAKQAYSQSLKISIELNDIAGQAWTEQALGGLYESQESYEKALLYYNQALPFFEENKDKRNIMNIQLGRVNSLIEMGEVEKAEKEIVYLESLTNELKHSENDLTIGLMRQQAKLSAAKGDFKTAFDLQTQITKDLQKMHERMSHEKHEELLVHYDMEKKENDNRVLQRENELKELKLQQKQREGLVWRLILAFVVVVLLVIGFLLHRLLLNRNHFQQMALKDHLTDAPNRRAILQFAERQFQITKRTKQPLTIAIIDLDYFKKINDNFGHEVGDAVLVAYAKAIKSSIRSQDMFGRYGGEEWLVVLTNTDLEDIKTIFERIKTNVSQIEIDNIEEDFAMTFSLGASQVESSDGSINEVIKRADECLYKAKEGGRNQFVTAI